MKRLLTILALLITVNCFGQFPVNQFQGSPSTLVKSRGGYGADSSYVYTSSYQDTAYANLGFLDNIAGATIRVGSYIYVRNASATKWVNQSLDITGCYALLNGGVVTWSGSGLIMDVSPASYVINCNPYSSPQSQVTLSASNPSLPRIDVIAVDTNNAVVVITGTAAANPVKPQVNPNSQLELTSILIPAGATTPGGVSQTVIYDQNAEWTGTASGVTVNFANTSNPFHLTIAADVSTIANGNSITFTNSSDVNAADYSSFKFYIRLKTAFTSSPFLRRYFTIQFFDGATAVTNQISVAEGQYGFTNSTVGSYQTVTIPFNSWLFSTLQFDKVQFTFNTDNASGLYLDWVQLQSGISSGSSLFITDVFRKTGTDSVFYIKNNVQVYAFKDSAGGPSQNFANTNLTLSGTRSHDFDNNTMTWGNVANFTIFDDPSANTRLMIGAGQSDMYSPNQSSSFSVNNSRASIAGADSIRLLSEKFLVDSIPQTTDSVQWKPVVWNRITNEVREYPYYIGGGGASSINVFDSLGWINPEAFGVIPDDGLDDTPEIQACLNYAASLNGDITIYFRRGVYNIDGALVTSVSGVNPNCQLYIPLTLAAGVKKTIRILGETPPQMGHSVLASNPLPVGGVIFLSSIVGTGTRPAIFGSPWTSSGFGDFNFTDVYMENLTVRARSLTGGGADTVNTMSGLNFIVLPNTPYINNVRVDIESELVDSEQPATGTAGIIFPGRGNGANVAANNIFVSGYDIGLLVNEHFNGNNLVVAACNEGVRIDSSDHFINITRLLTNGCVTGIRVQGTSSFTIWNYATERIDDLKWYDAVYDLFELVPGNSRSNIYYRGINGYSEAVLRRNNYVASRVVSYHPNQGLPLYNSTTRPTQLTDTGTIWINRDTWHQEYPNGTTNLVVPYIGQTSNLYTTGSSIAGFGGNPSSATYKVNIFDSSGAVPNLLSMHTAGHGVVRFNTSGAAHQTAILFQKAGTTIVQIGANVNTDGTPDFYVYDQVNSLTKIYIPTNTSHVFIGGNALTSPGMVVQNNGSVGILMSTASARLHLPAGVATASFAPLKFTSGTNLTTPEAGVMEYNGTSFFLTPSATRLRIALSDNTIPTVGQVLAGNGTNYTNSYTPVIGLAGTSTGTLGFSGTTSGTVTIQPQAAAGTYNFNLPTTAGSAGQYLTSQGGGSTAMTWTTPPTLTSGVHTPTATGVTNITSVVANANTTYTRIGDIVCVSGSVLVNAAAETVDSEFGLSLPVASNFTASTEGGGAGSLESGTINNSSVVIAMDATNDRASFRFHAPSSGSSILLTFTYSYRVTPP
jgi:hypothetical protein